MVLVRHDGVKRPLQPPYDGPFPVLESGDKVFKILRNGLPYTVSVDRLKPCNVPLTPPLSSIIPNRLPPPPHPIYDRAPPLQCPRTDVSTPACPRTDDITPDSSPTTPLSTNQELPPPRQLLLRRHSPRSDNPGLSPTISSGSSPLDLQSSTDFPPLDPPKFTMSG